MGIAPVLPLQKREEERKWSPHALGVHMEEKTVHIEVKG